MAKVTVIPQKINPITKLTLNEKPKKKVAAYARVSTDDEMQLTSYVAQVDYYTTLIQKNEEWEFIKVYADEGITGTSTKKRKEFNEMINDALAGKIDLIITKSVSRFARNTVDSLTAIRKLKEKGVEVYFEKENIYTLDSKGELLVTIMSSLAQDEARNISENVTWGQRKRFSDGKYDLVKKNFLGYKKDENGNIVIVEEEAETIKKIYRLFLEGATPSAIAKKLDETGVKTPGAKMNSKSKWSFSTILSILKNEKYKGDALLQKSITVDFLEHKRKMNEGEAPQYYVTKGHPAIIDPVTWDRVQFELKRREQIGYSYSSKDVFSCMIKCKECGSYFGKKVWHSNDPYKRVVWRCNHMYDGEKKCESVVLDEDTIKEAFVIAYNEVCVNKESIIEAAKLMINSPCDFGELDKKLAEHEEELGIVSEKIQRIINDNASVALDQTEYEKKYNYLASKFDKLNTEVTNLKDERARRKNQ